LHLPQHGVDAEDSGPLQDFRVWDPVLPSQLQYSAEATEMKVIQLPGLVRVDCSGLRSVKECFHDDSLVNLHFGVQVNTVAISHGGLQSADGLTSFGDPLGNLIIDSRVVSAAVCPTTMAVATKDFEASIGEAPTSAKQIIRQKPLDRGAVDR
uniref:TMEM132 domain-containing protein n=1 Tax=Schistocephalus solidus TaxID=70667 RepID=A0A183TQ85_SCHSO